MASGWLAASAAVSILLTANIADAVVGNCETNGGQNCISAIQNSGGVVNDIFKDTNGKTGPNLPVFGQLYNAWPGCTIANSGNYQNFYQGTESQCPNVPGHNTGSYDFATTATSLNALDWKYSQPVRLRNGHGTSQGGACPSWDQSGTWVDENGASSHDGYVPREGLVWDLGGPSNKVAIFAVNDHGPQPCESVEYTVWLTNDPTSTSVIDNPTTAGADPAKWNRAVLKQIFTHGWIDQRTPSPGNGCGDTALYAVEADSFVTVYGLPCGIAFRYVSIINGNDGLDFSECSYDSFDGEIDAVAGLTEEGAGVCADADKDGFVDCKCPGAPAICDCKDADPNIHPGAPEPCDSGIDLDCDEKPGACAAGLFCNASICVPTCKGGEVGNCPPGATCQSTDQGLLCIPTDCTTGGCPPGSVCDSATKTCKPACTGVVCPYGQTCQDGKCVDPCANVKCPAPLECVLGECRAPCSCFAGDAGCPTGLVCDKGATDQCIEAACQGKTCAAGEHCNATGNCVGLCDGVSCPQGQKCDATLGCIALCDGVTCGTGEACDPATGTCAAACDPACILPATCVAGKCTIAGSGGSGSGGTGAVDGGSAASGGKPPKGGTSGAEDDGGCGCTTPGSKKSAGALLALLALVFAAHRRSATVRRRGKRR